MSDRDRGDRVEDERPAGRPGARRPTDGSAEGVDEVGFDLGPDERGRGLLEPLTGTHPTTSLGEEHTGIVNELRTGEQPTVALLTRLAAWPEEDGDPERFSRLEGTPCEAIKALVADEPVDPLPVPDGLGAGARPWAEVERTAEVTAVRLNPLRIEADEGLERTQPVTLEDLSGGFDTSSGPTEATTPRVVHIPRNILVFAIGVAFTLLLGSIAVLVFWGALS